MVTKVIVKDVLYDMPAKEAAKELGINYSTLMTRVNSKNEKWKDWKVSEFNPMIKINGRHYEDIDKAIFALLDIKHRKSKRVTSSISKP